MMHKLTAILKRFLDWLARGAEQRAANCRS